jgi:exopolysaccharide biosynthesis polyprenyl glycosylphosphotransferase
MRKKIRIFWHVFFDWLAASFSWLVLFLYRKNYVEAVKHGYTIPINQDIKLYAGLIIIPLFWVMLYAMSGYYQHILRRSRLVELENTFANSLLGVIILFFALILDDSVSNYYDYYSSLAVLFGFHFFTTLFFRLINSTYTIHNIRSKKWGYNTLLIGTGPKAIHLISDLEKAKVWEGFNIKGLVQITEQNLADASNINLSVIGNWNSLPQLIKEYNIEDIILCNEPEESEYVPQIIDIIQNEEIHLKMLPNEYNLVLGMVKMNNILGTILAEVDFEVMPYWQKFIKRGMDIFISLIALVCLSPILLLIAFFVKIDSKGPIFFLQDRIGLRGIPFKIIKFRSMRANAETSGPQLSSDSDDRRTKVGIFLRKTRLDELPQFLNVLLGQMSLVGPRPERQFFIDQIVAKAPIYKRLHRVKPGITSWGQIKYGYAEDVTEMIDRMKFDILYLENMSLGLDIKIMFNTALIMIQGRGK